MTRRPIRPPLEPSALVADLAAADDPPTELAPYIGRLRNAGATALYVGKRTDRGALFELVLASWQIDWARDRDWHGRHLRAAVPALEPRRTRGALVAGGGG